jgi:hypothetical protein
MKEISITYVSRHTSDDKKNVPIYLNIRASPFPGKRVSSRIIVPSKNFTRGSIVGTGKEPIEKKKRLEMI